MLQMLGVFAEFERGIIRERINAGLARALKASGDGILKIGRKLGIGASVVQRVVAAISSVGSLTWGIVIWQRCWLVVGRCLRDRQLPLKTH